MYTCTSMYICSYICLYIYIHSYIMCIYTYIYVYMFLYIFIHKYVYIVYIYIYTHAYMAWPGLGQGLARQGQASPGLTRAWSGRGLARYICTCMCTYIYMNIYVYIYICMTRRMCWYYRPSSGRAASTLARRCLSARFPFSW